MLGDVQVVAMVPNWSGGTPAASVMVHSGLQISRNLLGGRAEAEKATGAEKTRRKAQRGVRRSGGQLQG